MVGLETAKWSDNSPADIGRLRSSCSTRRRVASERALNTLFTSLYLANHRTIVKRQFRSTSSQEWDDSDVDNVIAFGFDWSRPAKLPDCRQHDGGTPPRLQEWRYSEAASCQAREQRNS